MQTFSLQFFSASSPKVSTWFNLISLPVKNENGCHCCSKLHKILDYYNHYMAILLADIFALLISHSFL